MNHGYKRNLVFAACCFGMLLFGISLITLGAVAPDLKQKFLLDGKGSGTLFSILPVGILAGSLLFGPVCDRYGYKSLFIFACLGMFARHFAARRNSLTKHFGNLRRNFPAVPDLIKRSNFLSVQVLLQATTISLLSERTQDL